MRKSFAFAFQGVWLCIKTERNFRFHLAAAFYVLLAAAAARLSEVEWIFILICIGAVLGSEILNTAIEKLCDTLHPDYSPGIGFVKDLTAGAVLMFSASSAFIGGIIFFQGEKIARLASFLSSHAALSAAILATIPFAVYLIFRRYKYDNKISNDNNSRAPKRR